MSPATTLPPSDPPASAVLIPISVTAQVPASATTIAMPLIPVASAPINWYNPTGIAGLLTLLGDKDNSPAMGPRVGIDSYADQE
jgi:hypothetical protein